MIVKAVYYYQFWHILLTQIIYILVRRVSGHSNAPPSGTMLVRYNAPKRVGLKYKLSILIKRVKVGSNELLWSESYTRLYLSIRTFYLPTSLITICRILIAKIRVPFHISPCGGNIVIGTSFSPSTSAFSCKYNSINAPCLFVYSYINNGI